MKGNISQHCVAGQNAIRGKDAEHNWVWHMLIAFHLDKFGSTAGREGCNRSGCSWKTTSHYVAARAPYGKCVCEVTAKGAWLLPHKHITQSLFISAPASLSVLGDGICLKSEGNAHSELELFSVAIKPTEVWWMRDSFNRINCRGTTLRGNDLCVRKPFCWAVQKTGREDKQFQRVDELWPRIRKSWASKTKKTRKWIQRRKYSRKYIKLIPTLTTV